MSGECALYGGRGIAPARGSGAVLWDTQGREYIDFFTGHGAAIFGHGVNRLQAALARAAEGVWSPGAGFDSPTRNELCRRLGALLDGGRVFLCNSGTEAIEAALKLAVSRRPGRVLACRRGFHGRTAGALGLTFNPKYRAPFSGIIPKVEHFAPRDLPGVIDESVCAVFIEPVQGEGGVYPLSPETGRAVTTACRECGAVLVADEIQTGMGRCGAVLASGLVGLEPDIVCLAKGLAGGLPVGAAVWRPGLGDFPPHTHGSTYGGCNIACTVATEALEMLYELNLPKEGAGTGEYFRLQLAGLPHVTEVRGMGMMTGLELDVPSGPLIGKLQDAGVLALTAGPRVLRFLPPYAATREQCAAVTERTARILAAL